VSAGSGGRPRVLVTGGAGFIGSHLVDALIERGHAVRILDCLAEQVHAGGRPPAWLNSAAELMVGDVCSTEDVSRALEGVEAVFHLAADVGVGQSMVEVDRYVRTNSLGTARLLRALIGRRGQVRKLVVPSSVSVYGEGTCRCHTCGVVHPPPRRQAQLEAGHWELQCPTCGQALEPIGTRESRPLEPASVYAMTKLDQERLCLIVGREHGIPTVALRYFNVYGPRQSLRNPYTGVCATLLEWLVAGQVPQINEDGNQSRDFVHVADVVSANLRALDTDRADFEALNIGTGHATSVRELVALLWQTAGRSVEPSTGGRFRPGDVRHSIADISRARALLGFVPRVPFSSGVRDLYTWGQAQHASPIRV
jgi:dTDP-L-rhamnose 4-epimerase